MNTPSPLDPKALLQIAREQVAANRYAFLRKVRDGKIVNKVLGKS